MRNRQLKNTIWSILDVISYPLLLILATPIFIEKLGANDYGIWMFINSILASLGILNFNFGDAIIKYIAKYKATENVKKIHNIVKTCFSINIIGSFVLFIFGIIISYVVSNFSSYSGNIGLLIRVSSISFCAKFIEQVLISIYKGYERYDTASLIIILSRTITILVNIILVLYNFSLLNILISTAIISIIFILGEIFFIKKTVSYLSFSFSLHRDSLNEIFSFSIWNWIQNLVGIFALEADKMLIATISGPITLAYYSIGSMVATRLYGISVAAASWIMPVVSRKSELNQSLYDVYNFIQTFIIISGILGYTFIFYFESIIFQSWLGLETYKESIEYIKYFLIYNVVTISTIVPYFFLKGSNYIRIVTYGSIFSLITSLILMYFFSVHSGSIGFIYGKIVSSIIVVPIWLIFVSINILKTQKLTMVIKLIAFPLMTAFSFTNFTVYSQFIVFIIFIILLFDLINSTKKLIPKLAAK